MTAAHCTEGKQPADIYVTVGSDDSNISGSFTVVNIVSHPSYNPANNKDFDFALLELATNLTFTDSITP